MSRYEKPEKGNRFSPAAWLWAMLGLAALVATPIANAQSGTSTPVVINDPGLRAAIEAKLGKTPGATITRGEMASMGNIPMPCSYTVPQCARLRAIRANIRDLTGLEYATGVTNLSLSRNNISDLRPLAGMVSLNYLSIFRNQISDVSPLAGLTNLRDVVIDYNQVSDFSPLRNLPWLDYLRVNYNPVSDASVFRGMSRLNYLSFAHTRVTDLSPLANADFPYLRLLYVNDNSIRSLAPIANLNLSRLNAHDNAIPYDRATYTTHIPAMQGRGIQVITDIEPLDFTVVSAGDGATLTWSPSTNQDNCFYETRWGAPGALNPWRHAGTATARSYTAASLPDVPTVRFELRGSKCSHTGNFAGFASARHLVLVDLQPSYAETVPDQVFFVGREILLPLPPAQGGNRELTYSLAPQAPEGMAFDPTTRTLSGTPTTPAPTTTYTLTATDVNGDTATTAFRVTVVVDTQPEFATTVPPQVLRTGFHQVVQLPTAEGGNGELTYALYVLTPSGAPAGLKYNWRPTTGGMTHSISGTPTAVTPPVKYRLTATDEDGDSASLEFTIEVEERDSQPSFAAQVQPQVFRVGVAATLELPPAQGGDGALTYALTPKGPEGMAFYAATRILSGTPTVVAPPATYRLTATDQDGDSAALEFTIEVQPAPDLTVEDNSPSFAGEVPAQTYRAGSPATLELPSAEGGDGELTYALTPKAPEGMAFDAATRILSGTPTMASPSATYRLTATDEDGDSAALEFTIEVQPDSVPTFGDAVVEHMVLRTESAASVTLPAATDGDGRLTYMLDPALPSTLAFDSDRRVVAGTPTEAMPRTAYTFSATDEDGDTATLPISIEVELDSKPTFAEAVAAQHYHAHAEIQPLVLPSVVGGDGEITYELAPALPPGLVFEATSRTVSGTPTEEASETDYTLTATDEDGDQATLRFKLTVGAAARLTITDASALEGQALSFRVDLSVPLAATVSVAYQVVDGTARVGSDYLAAGGNLTLAAGAEAATIRVQTVVDQRAEPDETLTVSLDTAVNAVLAQSQATGTIEDDDREPLRRHALSQSLALAGRSLAGAMTDALNARFDEHGTVAGDEPLGGAAFLPTLLPPAQPTLPGEMGNSLPMGFRDLRSIGTFAARTSQKTCGCGRMATRVVSPTGTPSPLTAVGGRCSLASKRRCAMICFSAWQWCATPATSTTARKARRPKALAKWTCE